MSPDRHHLLGFTTPELLLIDRVLNELCDGALTDESLRDRLACTRDDARRLRDRIHAALAASGG